ncbi:type IV conjugative transfer system protein TraE [Photobacterium sp. ZSDE20]|uniref:Type IV conjugative transfer system protein TraE n=1 Tax=Photobacterium pectinilyticum TaxID=2906793 RepID=A0ABT1N0X9_9GAMM|nr:type IV conjugative transfer system protein TraE [Photobacterium sp. ZSDE20]MCQ1058400.1 type IV conjugative transfer system protein TraE [Photobacterium sp. ZSDE20]MDD1825237.1 type IV conjugative transfer system protein TraE [Photobacterium sp. ZSDE20]
MLDQLKNSKVARNYTESLSLSATLSKIAILQGLAILGLLYALMQQQITTVVTPPTFTEPLSMRGDQVSRSYQTGWAMFIAQTLGNVSPARLEFTISMIEKMIPIQDLPVFRSQLEEQVARLQVSRVQETFSPVDVVFDPKNDVVWVYGEKISRSLRQGTEIKMSWTYEMKIGSHLGSPKILHLAQYEGAPNRSRRQQELKGELAEH